MHRLLLLLLIAIPRSYHIVRLSSTLHEAVATATTSLRENVGARQALIKHWLNYRSPATNARRNYEKLRLLLFRFAGLVGSLNRTPLLTLSRSPVGIFNPNQPVRFRSRLLLFTLHCEPSDCSTLTAQLASAGTAQKELFRRLSSACTRLPNAS